MRLTANFTGSMVFSSVFTLLTLCGNVIAGSVSGYATTIPESAVIVSDWTSLYTGIAKYPDSILDEKYGGRVIEIEGKIVLATDDDMTRQINEKIDAFGPTTAEDEELLEKRTAEMAAGSNNKTLGSCPQAHEREGSTVKRDMWHIQISKRPAVVFSSLFTCAGGLTDAVSVVGVEGVDQVELPPDIGIVWTFDIFVTQVVEVI
ncbi:hypothetical protein Q7P37_010316 [Cladosporium fusiforme]